MIELLETNPRAVARYVEQERRERVDLASRAPQPWRGAGRVELLGEPGAFRVVCDCEGAPRELYRVEGDAGTLLCYHLRHAWGGMHHECPSCGMHYAHAGLIDEELETGAVDVVCLERVDLTLPRYTGLTPLQAHVLDVANERDHAIWEDSVRAVKNAQSLRRVLGRSTALEQMRWINALRLRAGLLRRKTDTLRQIAWEHGLQAFPRGTRLFRTLDAAGVIDWGEGGPPRREGSVAELLKRGAQEASSPRSPWKIPDRLR